MVVVAVVGSVLFSGGGVGNLGSISAHTDTEARLQLHQPLSSPRQPKASRSNQGLASSFPSSLPCPEEAKNKAKTKGKGDGWGDADRPGSLMGREARGWKKRERVEGERRGNKKI